MKPLATDIESRLWWTMARRLQGRSPTLSAMYGRRFWTRLGRWNA